MGSDTVRTSRSTTSETAVTNGNLGVERSDVRAARQAIRDTDVYESPTE